MPHAFEPSSPGVRRLLARSAAPFDGLDPAERHALLDVALREGILALAADRLPPGDRELRARLDRLAAGMRLRDARVREGLEEALAALGAAGVEPVALKGPTLAHRLYPAPALRAATDVDLLVPEELLFRSADALCAAGFRRADPLQDAYQLRHHHHLHLHGGSRPDVELHFRAVSAFDAAVPTTELVGRALPHRTDRGTPVRVLAPEDELVVLAIHAAGHQQRRAGWLLDLLLLLERHPDLDWAEVGRRATAWRCRRALAYALIGLRSLGARVPDLPHLRLSPTRRRMADRLASLARRLPGKPGGATWMAFQWVLRDRAWTIPMTIASEVAWVVRRRTPAQARRRSLGPRPSSQHGSDPS